MRNTPAPLINEIVEGNCVVFVDAGFSAPAVPNWDALLHGIAADCKVSNKTEEKIKELLGHMTECPIEGYSTEQQQLNSFKMIWGKRTLHRFLNQ